MAEESWPEKDLWGEPGRPPKDPRGRKRHKYDPQTAETIAVLRAQRFTDAEIARQIGLSIPTMQKYYFESLDGGAEKAKAVVLKALYDKAKTGVSSAARAFLDYSDRDVRVGRRAGAQPKAPAIGKKAAAVDAAGTAHEGTGWDGLVN